MGKLSCGISIQPCGALLACYHNLPAWKGPIDCRHAALCDNLLFSHLHYVVHKSGLRNRNMIPINQQIVTTTCILTPKSLTTNTLDQATVPKVLTVILVVHKVCVPNVRELHSGSGVACSISRYWWCWHDITSCAYFAGCSMSEVCRFPRAM